MRKLIPLFVVLGVFGAFGATVFFLLNKSKPAPKAVQTTSPMVTDIVRKSVAAGQLEPRQEVAIKPQTSGIVSSLHVNPGDQVKTGDLIAIVEIIPDLVRLNDAELQLKSAAIRVQRSRQDFERAEALFKRNAYPKIEFDRLKAEYDLAVEQEQANRSRVQLLRKGTAKGRKNPPTGFCPRLTARCCPSRYAWAPVSFRRTISTKAPPSPRSPTWGTCCFGALSTNRRLADCAKA